MVSKIIILAVVVTISAVSAQAMKKAVSDKSALKAKSGW